MLAPVPMLVLLDVLAAKQDSSSKFAMPETPLPVPQWHPPAVIPEVLEEEENDVGSRSKVWPRNKW